MESANAQSQSASGVVQSSTAAPRPDIYSDIGVSVLASVLAVMLIALGRLLWARIGEDLWLQLAWRHLPDISGEWRSTKVDKEAYSYDETMRIDQHGWRVSGEIEYREYEKGGEIKLKKIFQFEGHFKERVLAILYASKDRKSLSTGSTVLFLKDDNEFAGGCAYYLPESGIATDKYDWVRVR